MQNQLLPLLGNIDIYLFDQLLKGTYDNCDKVLDAGCGAGRNLVYFLKSGFDVYAVDPDPEAITAVTELAAALSPGNPQGNFVKTSIEDMPYPDAFFDLVISSAVLHFANDEQHFKRMLFGMWRVLKPGGFLFARLASDIGIEQLVLPLGNGRHFLPDGSERYLVNEQQLLTLTHELGAYLHEPIKTTNVQHLRCMTTWCLQKL